ncbi:MAG: response regulator transcription factor [Clostridiales bacterium]|jgi:DNA-binding response OmpR family regulator|nr:response regulator transcription factor [Clostridiales bacterium]
MTDKPAILLVEDNKAILAANQRIFTGAGYAVYTAETLARAWEIIEENPPDVIVLDILLPDGNGLDFIRQIRAVTIAPVLLLTSLDDRDDRLAGLRAGGDDYITKPYDVAELRERVAAFLRREALHRGKPAAETVTCGPLTLNVVLKRAFVAGEDMLLAPKEFELLYYFLKNEGKILSADEIYKAVWVQPDIGDLNPLRATISRLRKKLGNDKTGAFSIEAFRGEGYLFAIARL